MVKRLHAEIKYQSDTGNVVSYDDYQALAAELAVQEDRHDIEVSDLAMREHALTARIAELTAAANEVLRVYMPQFNDSRAVDDCLVGLAAAVAGVSTSLETKGKQ